MTKGSQKRETAPPESDGPGEAGAERPQRKLDQETVAALVGPPKAPKGAKQVASWVYMDNEIPGFCCQVTYNGTKTFRLRYRKSEGGPNSPPKQYSIPLGRWRDGKETKAHPETPEEQAKRGVTAGQARRLAAAMRALVEQGKNPALEVKLQATEQKTRNRAAMLVTDAWREYLDYARTRGKPMKADSIEQAVRSFENHIEPRIGNRYMTSLSSEDVADLAKEVTASKKVRKGRKVGGPSAATHAVAHLSAFLTWAKKQKIVPENVAQLIDRGDVLKKAKPRKRYLSRDEWAAVMHELDEWPHWVTRGSRFKPTTTTRVDEPQLRQLVSCEALRLGLLTGSRKGEVYKMRWADVDLENRWWIKPSETMKSGDAHEIPLSRLAVESLRKVQAAHGDPVYPFPGKLRLDKIIGGRMPKDSEGGPVKDVHELWTRIRDKLGLGDVTIHDLRHTAASVLISSGHTLQEVGDQLGHSQAQTTMRYAHLFEERKRAMADSMDSFAERNPSKPQADGAKSAKRPNRVQ